VKIITDIDYTKVNGADLEMRREPRKSKFSVVHKPTGAVAEDPVAPGNYAEVRFRRPAGMPKENRPKDMTGYVESRSETGGAVWPIIETTKKEGDKDVTTVDNQFLTALANDPEALKRSFEGQPAEAGGADAESASSNGASTTTPEAAAAAAAAAAGTAQAPQAPAAPAPEADAVELPGEQKKELDDLLAGLE
jgi:hypothetical protein